MELLIFILVLLGCAVAIGGFAGFVALFSSSSKDTKLRDLERDTTKLSLEVMQLNVRLEKLKKAMDASMSPPQAATLNTDNRSATTMPMRAAEGVPTASTHIPSEEDLTAQALAVKNASIEIEKENTASPPAPIPTPVRPTPVRQNRTPIQYQPNVIERGLTYAKDWLFGGNTLVRSGIVILFIGISFLIKYAAERTHVPIELRLMGIVLGGIAMLALGWSLRNKRPQYAWALQGGGIGVLYLVIFAALKLYQIIPAGPAFALLAAVAFLSALIAVKQSALPLAILGFLGGFLAPILTSTGQGSHVALFSYYLVLNLAIAFVAFHKSWRPLNVLGWAFTFIIGTVWGAKNYAPEHFATTEPFLVIFFLLFTGIAVVYAHKQATQARDYIDETLIFGTPLVAFSLQYALLRDSSFGLAYSALTLGIFYIGLAWWTLTSKRDTLKFLGESFLALGVGFATLTLPLALDGRWTSAAWAVEGVGLLWVGLKQKRMFPALAGLALQALGAGAFVFGWGLTGHVATGSQNMFLGAGFIALSGWACGALINKYRPTKWDEWMTPFAAWGWAWWVCAGLMAIDAFMTGDHLMLHADLVFVTLTSLLLPFAAKSLKWQRLATLSTLLLPAMAIAWLWEFSKSLAPAPYSVFENYGLIAWPLAFATYAWLMSRDTVPNKAWLRAPLLWLIAAIGILEWQHQLWDIVRESSVWSDIGWGVVPMMLVGAITYWQFAKKTTLSATQLTSAHIWAWVGGLPLMALVVIWYLVMSLNSDGNAAPLRYIPLLNPLDIALAGGLLLLLIWQRMLSKHLDKLQHINPLLASIMAFALLNGMLLRTLHHWIGTPYLWVSIFTNATVQMAFTILWGLTAFSLMLLGHQRLQRQLWIAGASLMAVVVAKLFLFDMAQTGTVARIVSFIGAGLMLLVMGYFAPLPPANTNTIKKVST